MEFLLDFSVLVGILGILDYNSRRIARRFVRRGAETRPSFPKERKFDIGLEWIVYIYIYVRLSRREETWRGKSGDYFSLQFPRDGFKYRRKFRAFLLALYLSAPRNTDRGFISVGMINR